MQCVSAGSIHFVGSIHFKVVMADVYRVVVYLRLFRFVAQVQ